MAVLSNKPVSADEPAQPASEQAKRGVNVAFFPWWGDNPYQVLLKQELNESGFQVSENPPLSLRRLLKGDDGLDVVHVHWPHGLYLDEPWRFPLVLTTLWLYTRLKDNVVWTVHELDFYETKFQWPDRVIRRLLLKNARALFVHARSSQEELRTRFGVSDRTVLAYHPSYAGHYPNEISREEARKRLGVSEHKKVFLYFGHVKAYKGVEDLIRAFRKLRDPSAVLYVVGNPRNRWIRGTVERLAARDVRIRTDLRFVPDEDVQVLFNAADVVVFPFRRTHTSGSIMLALTFGKPIIAPAIASIPEYVNDSMAVLFDPDDPDALDKALQKALTSDLSAMGEAARRQAEHFTWQAMAKKHAEVYNAISSGTRRA